MKERRINIPVNVITSGLIIGTGVCTSVIVDNLIKQNNAEITGDKKVDKVINDIGRAGAKVLIGTAFTTLAIEAYKDKSLNMSVVLPDTKVKPISTDSASADCSVTKKDVQILETTENRNEKKKDKKLNKEEKRYFKIYRRFEKVSELWDLLFKQATELDKLQVKEGEEIPELYRIDVLNIQKFNSKMKKLSNSIGFEYDPIMESRDINLMKDDIIKRSDEINEHLGDVFKYLNFAELEGATENNIENTIMEEIKTIFSNLDDTSYGSLKDEAIKKMKDPEVVNTVKLFSSGELSAVEACDRFVSYITTH